MGRRNILKAYPVFSNIDITSPPVGPVTDVSGIDNITYMIRCDAGVVAEMGVYVSSDDDPINNFIALDFGEQILINGSTETEYTIKIQNHGFKYINLDFISNSGTGNLTAHISGNTVGA